MADDKFSQDLARTDAQGKTRFGDDHWKTAVDALGRALGPGGIPEAGMRAILQQPDPARDSSGSLAIFAAIRRAAYLGDQLGRRSDPIGLSCPHLLLSPKEVAYLGGRQWNGSSRKHR